MSQSDENGQSVQDFSENEKKTLSESTAVIFLEF